MLVLFLDWPLPAGLSRRISIDAGLGDGSPIPGVLYLSHPSFESNEGICEVVQPW